jgi:hypothetical protein
MTYLSVAPGVRAGLNPAESLSGKVKAKELADLCANDLAEVWEAASVPRRFLDHLTKLTIVVILLTR